MSSGTQGLAVASRAERDTAPESRGGAFPELPAPMAGGEAVRGALSLVDRAASPATALASSATSGTPIGAIDGAERRDRETAPAAARNDARAARPDDLERLRSELAETIKTARRLAPVATP